MSNPSHNPDRQRVPPGRSFMVNGEQLFIGESLISPQGNYRATLQADGNFVVYDAAGHAQWATGTNGRPVRDVFFDLWGNVVLEEPTRAAWTSQTANGDSVLFMQNDGNLVLYIQWEGKPFAAWSSRNGKAGHSTVFGSVLSVAGIVFPVAVVPVLFATGNADAGMTAIATDVKAAGQFVSGNIGGAAATVTGAVVNAASAPPPSLPDVAAQVVAAAAAAGVVAPPPPPPTVIAYRPETFREWWRRVFQQRGTP